MNQRSYKLFPHPDGGVFAVWETPLGLYAGWREVGEYSGFYGPTAKDVATYQDIRRNDPLLVKPEHRISNLSLYPVRIYPEFRHAPVWVRKAAYLAGVKGAVQTYETGYTYMPDRLVARVSQPDGRILLLFSRDLEQLDFLTWKQAKEAKEQGKATVGKSRNIRFLNWN